jgi:acyl carrier protein
MSQTEIYGKVSATLADTLAIDPAKILPSSRLVGDLGAESIDVLEIVYRLENEFGVEIPLKELSPSDPKPATALGKSHEQRHFTVETITHYLCQQLLKKPGSVT